ncbi:MAG: hypothetical protein B1H11_12550 [Desulfobacteraceae bacterium 4484_190.1]|nr:MAG: hypothetical protein B1H11_12550 [Desulfobacteraceae bacterium 4484_190.1]
MSLIKNSHAKKCTLRYSMPFTISSPEASIDRQSFRTKQTIMIETFEKHSVLFKVKPAGALPADREDENFNRRNTLSILRIKV